MVGILERIDDRVRFDGDIDIRARNQKTADVHELRIMSGSGTPTSATGSLAEAGSLYVDTSGTGKLYIKTSRINGAYDDISNTEGRA